MGCCQSTPRADQVDPAQTAAQVLPRKAAAVEPQCWSLLPPRVLSLDPQQSSPGSGSLNQACLQHPAVAAKQEPAAPAAAPEPVGSTTAHLKAPAPLKPDLDSSNPEAAGIPSAPAVEHLKAGNQPQQPDPASTAQSGAPLGSAPHQEAAATSLPLVVGQGTALGPPPAVSSKLTRKSFIEVGFRVSCPAAPSCQLLIVWQTARPWGHNCACDGMHAVLPSCEPDATRVHPPAADGIHASSQAVHQHHVLHRASRRMPPHRRP